MRKPLPEEHGLPSGFDWHADKARIEALDARVGCLGGLVGFLGGCALATLLANILYPVIGNWALASLPVVFLGSIAAAGWLSTSVLLPWLADVDLVAAKRFGEALEAYEYHECETGVGFWRDLRGIPFERAVARLFSNRGAPAKMTATTGDGGIDLILTIAGTTCWCQCKGHASPISVAPIREIAGVCSKERVRPVVFAVNGFTKAARDTARQLAVTLVDAPRLAALARANRITDL